MKKLIIIFAALCISSSIFAYTMLSWGGKASLTVPIIDTFEPKDVGVEFGSFNIFLDGLYAFNNGLTIGLEASFNLPLALTEAKENSGESFAAWGVAPMIGYTFLDKVFFQALFQPLSLTSSAGLTSLFGNNPIIDYKTGIQTYIGLVGSTWLGAGAISLGLGAYSYWGHQEILPAGGSSFKGLGKFSLSISLRYTELFAPVTHPE